MARKRKKQGQKSIELLGAIQQSSAMQQPVETPQSSATQQSAESGVVTRRSSPILRLLSSKLFWVVVTCLCAISTAIIQWQNGEIARLSLVIQQRNSEISRLSLEMQQQNSKIAKSSFELGLLPRIDSSFDSQVSPKSWILKNVGEIDFKGCQVINLHKMVRFESPRTINAGALKQTYGNWQEMVSSQCGFSPVRSGYSVR